MNLLGGKILVQKKPSLKPRHPHQQRFGHAVFDEAIRPGVSRRAAEMSGGDCLKKIVGWLFAF
jgi:hypothetical protein